MEGRHPWPNLIRNERQNSVKPGRGIEQARINKAWTRSKLAEAAGYDVRTIRTLLEGEPPVRDQTILDVCLAAELTNDDEYFEASDEIYGAYARASYRKYEGVYFGFRRSFTYQSTFVRSVFKIKWDEEDELFIFKQYQCYISANNKKIDHSQVGRIYISPLTDLLHFLTIDQGAVRLVTLTKMRGNDDTMRGSLLTQSERTMFFQPAVSAIYLQKLHEHDLDVYLKSVGPIGPGDDAHTEVMEQIEAIERDVMFTATPKSTIGKAEPLSPAPSH